jgi:DNA segregation ATPase FtsK/SpoIIIE-like protein
VFVSPIPSVLHYEYERFETSHIDNFSEKLPYIVVAIDELKINENTLHG